MNEKILQDEECGRDLLFVIWKKDWMQEELLCLQLYHNCRFAVKCLLAAHSSGKRRVFKVSTRCNFRFCFASCLLQIMLPVPLTGRGVKVMSKLLSWIMMHPSTPCEIRPLLAGQT